MDEELFCPERSYLDTRQSLHPVSNIIRVLYVHTMAVALNEYFRISRGSLQNSAGAFRSVWRVLSSHERTYGCCSDTVCVQSGTRSWLRFIYINQ